MVKKLMNSQPSTVGRADANLRRKLRQLLPPLWRQTNFKSFSHAAMLRQPSGTATHREWSSRDAARGITAGSLF
jgi:hypothetical protein